MDAHLIILAIVFPVMMICVFSFLSIAIWSMARRKEREALYRSETMKKVAEGLAASGTTVLEMLQAEERLARARRREGYKLGGLVAIGTGIGLIAFLNGVEQNAPVYLVGLIPTFVGVAMLAYVFLFGPRD